MLWGDCLSYSSFTFFPDCLVQGPAEVNTSMSNGSYEHFRTQFLWNDEESDSRALNKTFGTGIRPLIGTLFRYTLNLRPYYLLEELPILCVWALCRDSRAWFLTGENVQKMNPKRLMKQRVKSVKFHECIEEDERSGNVPSNHFFTFPPFHLYFGKYNKEKDRNILSTK